MFLNEMMLTSMYLFFLVAGVLVLSAHRQLQFSRVSLLNMAVRTAALAGIVVALKVRTFFSLQSPFSLSLTFLLLCCPLFWPRLWSP